MIDYDDSQILYRCSVNDKTNFAMAVKMASNNLLASGRRSRPSRVKDRAWYHSNRLDQLIHLQPLDCLVMDIRWGKTWVKVENSSKKRF